MENTNQPAQKQKIDEGYGAVYHRIYSVKLPIPMDAGLLKMKDLQKDPNQYSPQILARFEKTKGSAESLSVGDEFMIHIAGPWDGPVRVTEVHPDRFRLETLEGHLEAGRIDFNINPAGDDGVVFKIESKARSRDAVVDFVYDKIPIARIAQTEMWTDFCQNFAKDTLKDLSLDEESASEVKVLTEKFDQETNQWQTV